MKNRYRIYLKANPILLESVRKDKRPGDVDEIHPMRDRPLSSDNCTLYIDPKSDHGWVVGLVSAVNLLSSINRDRPVGTLLGCENNNGVREKT